MVLYHKRSLVYAGFYSQFLIFQTNNSTQTSVFIFSTYGHQYIFTKLKIVGKKLRKLNWFNGKYHIPLNGKYDKLEFVWMNIRLRDYP